MEPNAYRYDAFISYRHISPDKAIAIRLQELLETYTPPKGSARKHPSRKLRVFRDESELPTSNDLGEDIKRALRESEYLIVVCSPGTEQSRWCMEEIAYFQSLHERTNRNILTLLVSPTGEPIFPRVLRYERTVAIGEDGREVITENEVEPLAANVSAPTEREALKKLKTEFLRLAAPLLGCAYDELYGRNQRRRAKRRTMILSISTAVLAVIAALSITALVTISRQKEDLRQHQSEILLQKSQILEESGRPYEALEAALEAAESDAGEISNSAFAQISRLTGAYRDQFFTQTALLHHPSPVNSFLLLGDGSRLITTDVTATRLWDTVTGECIKEYDGASDPIMGYESSHLEQAVFDYYAVGTIRGREIGSIFYYVDCIRRDIDTAETRVDESTAYIINETDDSRVLCRINPNDGSYLWEHEIGEKDKVYPPQESNQIICGKERLSVLSAETGEEIASVSEEEFSRLENPDIAYVAYTGSAVAFVGKLDNSYYIGAFTPDSGGYTLSYLEKMSLSSYAINLSFKAVGDTLYIAGEDTDDALRCTPFVQAYHLSDGSPIWSRESDMINGGQSYIGYIGGGDGAVTKPTVIAVVGSRLFICDAVTGESEDEIYLPANAAHLYYSDNGYILIIDQSGLEYGISASTEAKQDRLKFLNNDFRGDLELASYLNNTYAALAPDSTDVAIYRVIRNDDVSTLCESSVENRAFSRFALSASKKRAAVCMNDPANIRVLDTQTKEELCHIAPSNNYNFYCELLSDDLLLVSQNRVITLYDVATGKEVRELTEDEYSTSDYRINRYAEEFAVLDRDGSLAVFSGREDGKVLIAAEEQDGTQSKVNFFFASDNFDRFFVDLRQRDSEGNYTDLYRVYHREDGSVTEVDFDEKINLNRLSYYAWQTERHILYLLIDDRIIAIDDLSGKIICDQKVHSGSCDLLLIDDTPCLLDSAGSLIRLHLDGNDIAEDESLSLGLQYPTPGLVTYEPLEQKGLGVLRYKHQAWIIDTDAFEIRCHIDGYAGIDEEKELVYIDFYDRIYTYPILNDAALIERADELIN